MLLCESAREKADGVSLTSEEMKGCVWLKPKLVAQIEFVEWTADGHVRHAESAGLRDGKDPRQVVSEDSRSVGLLHPKITKISDKSDNF